VKEGNTLVSVSSKHVELETQTDSQESVIHDALLRHDSQYLLPLSANAKHKQREQHAHEQWKLARFGPTQETPRVSQIIGQSYSRRGSLSTTIQHHKAQILPSQLEQVQASKQSSDVG